MSSLMKLTSSASFSPSIRISLRLKIHQAQAKNFCRVLDIRVPQVVKAYTFKAVRIRKVAKPSAGRVMMQLRAIPCMDNPAFADPEMRGGALAILLIGAGLIEHRHHADRQRDDSLPSFAFRRAFKVAGLRSVLQGVADVDGAALPVHVAEPQGTDFTKRHFNPHSPHGER